MNVRSHPCRLRLRFGSALRIWLTTSLLSLSSTASADPRYDYLLHCAGCHLEDGSGAPPEVPDLRRDLDRLLASESGRAYLARVPGAAQVPIDDRAMSELLNWMVDAFRPDLKGFEPFEATVIGPLRDKPLKDPLRFRELVLDGSSPPPDLDI